MNIIATNTAPAAIGPYSQATAHGGLIFCSGQIPIDPSSGDLVLETVEAQTTLVLNNLEAVLKAAGSSRSQVLKCTIYLSDMDDFALVNQVYGEFFGKHKPARATVEVSRLPKDVSVEIECVASN